MQAYSISPKGIQKKGRGEVFMYGLDYAIKSFAVANEFVVTLNKVSHTLGGKLQPFSLCSDEYQKKHNVLDLAKFAGLQNGGMSLIDEVSSVRRDLLVKSGYHVGELDDAKKKTLFYQYLMTVSICYVEVEKWKTVSGVTQPTYDKFLCTRNPAIIGAWMGITPGEAQAKYSARIKTDNAELDANIVRFVKLNQSAKGNSVTVPRTLVSTEKMRCVPLFMLYAWMEGCKTVLQNNIVKFTFLKDNHTEREMCSTLSEDIIRRYYSDNNFISYMFGGIDINSTQQGGMMLSSKAHRGYVKLPELGSSIYDSSGTRSLNLARILEAKIVDDIDTSYINVSLTSVVPNFQNCLDYCVSNMPSELIKIAKTFAPDIEVSEDTEASVIAIKLSEWASMQETLLSTQFQRELHKMLIGNPQWFPLYTGVKTEQSPVSSNFGVEQLDF